MENLFYLAGILLCISGLPQTIKLVTMQESRDISLTTYIITLLAVLILDLKSLQVGDWALIFANGVSTLTLSVNLFLIWRYR